MTTGKPIDPAWSAVAPEWKLRMAAREDPGRDSGHEAFADADDRALVDATLGGRREAFDEIVRRHQRQVYQVCFRFVGNHEDASDLAQDVFVRAFRGLNRFKAQAALSTWLYRIAVNVSLNRVGGPRRTLEPLDGTEQPDRDAERPDAALLRAERGRQVRAAVARLPPRQRAALILRVYHELPHEEIARILGSSVGAVKANFFHALGNLKKLLRERP